MRSDTARENFERKRSEKEDPGGLRVFDVSVESLKGTMDENVDVITPRGSSFGDLRQILRDVYRMRLDANIVFYSGTPAEERSDADLLTQPVFFATRGY